MGYVSNTVLLRRPIEPVFDKATTALYWVCWHPATLGVRGAVDHPVQQGEHITERAHIAGRTASAEWTCVERTRPHHLALEALGPPIIARIVYTFDQRGSEVVFTRTLTYTVTGLLGGLIDTLILRDIMKKQSAQAMLNLKAWLEAEIPEG